MILFCGPALWRLFLRFGGILSDIFVTSAAMKHIQAYCFAAVLRIIAMGRF